MKKLLLLLALMFLLIPKPCPAATYQPIYGLKHSSFKALYPPIDGNGEQRIPCSLTDLEYSPSAFRVYIPPGTIRAVVNFYLFDGDKDIGFAIRYQRPPACAYCRCLSSYDQIPWATSLVRMSDVTQGDVYTENHNGLSKILTFSSSTPLPANKAGWLYIKKIPFKTLTIRDIAVDIKVDATAYRQWYNNATWGPDGNPPGAGSGSLPGCSLNADEGGSSAPVVTPPPDNSNPLFDLLHPEPESSVRVYVVEIAGVEYQLTLSDKAVITTSDITLEYDYVVNGCFVILSSKEYGELKLLKYGDDLMVVLPDAIILRKVEDD